MSARHSPLRGVRAVPCQASCQSGPAPPPWARRRSLPLDTPHDPFAAIRALATGAGGFYLPMTHHVAAHVPAATPDARRTLVVVFDNLAAPREDPRMPWGHRYILGRGWDVLGIMMKRPDWYRHPDVWDLFDRLRDEGFFAGYDHVAMYGASMGAYGALAFAPAAPGCTVVALAPQTTLDPRIAPFETRYRVGRRIGDWSGRYADAADSVRAAGTAYVVFDPREAIDLAHARRLQGENVVHLPLAGVGHKIPPALQKMGLLKPFAADALAGTLTPRAFWPLYRARRDSVPWIVGLIEQAVRRGHPGLALKAAERAMAIRPHWKIRHQLRALREGRKAGGQ